MKKSERMIHTLDATDQAPGRLASHIAHLLIGKHKASFAPNVDNGDTVAVVNAAKLRLTGKKMEQKEYYHHTMYPKGLKTEHARSVFADDPSDMIRRAVSRMLPKNTHRTERLKRLTITN